MARVSGLGPVVDGETQQRGEDEEADAGRDADHEGPERPEGRPRRLQPSARVEERPGRLHRPLAYQQRSDGEHAEQREHGHEIRPVDDDEELAVHDELPDAEGDDPHLGVHGGVLHFGGCA